MAPPTSKEINLIIEGKNLAGKPLTELDREVQKLVKSVETLGPASDKGEAKLDELRAVAGQLKEALKGLAANAGVLETFEKISATVSEAGSKLGTLRQRLDDAKLALANAAAPTKTLQKEVTNATTAFTAQEKVLNKQVAALDKVKGRAAEAGLDLANVAGEQSRINAVLQTAAPAYERISGALTNFAANQRKAAESAQAAANLQKIAAAEQATAARAAEAIGARRVAALQGLLQEQQASAAAATRIVRTQEASAAAFRREVEAVEAARRKLTEKVVADNEAASAALRLAQATSREEAAIKASTAAKERAAHTASDWAAMEARAAAALQQTAGHIDRAATAQGKLTNAFSLFRDEGRTTLSLYQRLRGEVLGLTSAFIGFYAAIQQVGKIIEANQSKSQARNIFAAAFGQENVAEQMKFVESEAERLGFALDKLLVSYGKFAVAATKSGASVEATQFIFSRVSEAARVLNLNSEATERIFNALQQIFNKQKVKTEELSQQLGDFLPAAVATFSKALGVSTVKFQKLLETGSISSDNLLLFAAELGKQYGTQLPAALNSTQAKIGRFQTAIFNLRNAIFEGEFGEAFGGAIEKLTKALSGQEGIKFAQQLSKGLGQVANGFVLLLENLDKVKLLLEIVAVRWTITFGLSTITGIAKVVRAIQSAVVALTALDVAAVGTIAGLGKMAGALGALTGGFALGQILNDQFESVRVFGVRFVEVFVLAFERIQRAWKVTVALIKHPFTSGEIIKAINAEFDKTVKGLMEGFNDQAAAARGTPTGPASAGAGGAGAAGGTPDAAAAKLAAEMARLRAQITQADAEALAKASATIQEKLIGLRANLLKKDATTVEEFVLGIREAYKPLFQDIAALKKDFGESANKTIRNLSGQLEAIIASETKGAADKFNLEKIKRDEEEINNLIDERNNAIAVQNQLKKAGAQSDELTKTKIAEIGNEFNLEISEKIKDLQRFLDSVPPDIHDKIQREAEKLKLLAATLIERPLVDPILSTKNQREAIDQQLQLRDKLIEGIKAEARATGEAQQTTIDKIKQVRSEYEQYVNLAKSLIIFIETSNTLTEDQRKALVGVKAELQIIVAENVRLAERLFTVADAAHTIADGIGVFADGFVRAAVASGNLSDGIRGALDAFRNFAADFLLKIGQMILQQTILNALQSSSLPGWLSGAVSAAAGGAGAVGGAHTGGHIGEARPKTHVVPNAVWLNAVRLHSGGRMMGLQSNEVPIIAKLGEEVLAGDDPRNSRNGGMMGAKVNIKMINAIDSASVVREGLNSPGVDKVLFNIIRAHRHAFRQAMA